MSGGADAHRASRPLGGVVAVVLAATLWGTTGTATHFAPGVPAVVFGAVTFGLGGLVLAVVAGRTALRAVADRWTRRWVLVGAGSLVVYAVAFYAALADAGVALGTTVAIGSSPLFAGLVERVVDGRRVPARWGTATVVSVAGMVAVTLARAGDVSGAAAGRRAGSALVDRELVGGLGWALLAGLTYATYSWAVARALTAAPRSGTAGVQPVAPGGAGRAGGLGLGVVGGVFGLAAVPLVVLALAVGGDHLAEARNWPVFLYLALVPTVLGHAAYAAGLRSVSASVGTLVSLLEPVVAAVLAVVVVGEHLGALGWVGVVLVVAGLAVLGVPGRRPRA